MTDGTDPRTGLPEPPPGHYFVVEKSVYGGGYYGGRYDSYGVALRRRVARVFWRTVAFEWIRVEPDPVNDLLLVSPERIQIAAEIALERAQTDMLRAGIAARNRGYLGRYPPNSIKD